MKGGIERLPCGCRQYQRCGCVAGRPRSTWRAEL